MRVCTRLADARWPTLLLLAALALWGSLVPRAAHAQGALPVDKLEGGVALMPYLFLYEDEARDVSFEKVRSPAFANRFQKAKSTAFGMSNATLWFRFDAHNASDQALPWLLELAYPHLDYVSLYVVRQGDPVEERVTGDLLPFEQRDVKHPNFVFSLNHRPGEHITYYLRVSTTGTRRVPLTAWTTAGYYDHELRHSVFLWAFYGALIMMALYNLAVWLLIQQSEYLTQALLLFSMWLVTFAFSGHEFQFLLPHHPLLANKALSFFLAVALCASTLSCSQVAARAPGYERFEQLFRRAAYLAASLALAVCVLPKHIGTIGVVTCLVVYVLVGVVCLITLTGRTPSQLRLYLASWYSVLIGVPLTILSHVGVLPEHPLLDWSAHIGCAMQAIFTSLALATRVKVMGGDLAVLNGQLSAQNDSLRDALERTRQANEAAQRATRAKDEFVATMSHELRTPLNAIINVPQGLLEDFHSLPSAACQSCHSEFLLEENERIEPSTVCPECQAQGSLVSGHTLTYEGNPNETTRYLKKIERSGKHLLQLVNSVLDYSKMEAGRIELEWAVLDLSALVRDVVDEMSELARDQGLTLALALPEDSALRVGDPLRIKQVLINLLSNALKFSERGGTVSVRVYRAEQSDWVTVQDQGLGIAPEHHQRIFERFEQVHKGDVRKYGGTGLGLSISRTLARMHGGDLTVQSELGQGATFTLRLPIQRPLTEPASAEQSGPRPAASAEPAVQSRSAGPVVG